MPLTPPADPEHGQSILQWAKRITQYLRQITPRDGPDIWPSIATTGTSFLLLRKPRGVETAVRKHPFQATITNVDFADGDFNDLTVRIQRGSVMKKSESYTDGVEIARMNDLFMLEDGHKIWIACSFSEAGAISDLTLDSGEEWDGYPTLYQAHDSDEGNDWFHPICAIRATYDDEPPDFSSDRVLDQLTSTHLVTQRQCIEGTLMWKLVPGPGARY